MVKLTSPVHNFDLLDDRYGEWKSYLSGYFGINPEHVTIDLVIGHGLEALENSIGLSNLEIAKFKYEYYLIMETT